LREIQPVVLEARCMHRLTKQVDIPRTTLPT
jgi:hypothetical protein